MTFQLLRITPSTGCLSNVDRVQGYYLYSCLFLAAATPFHLGTSLPSQKLHEILILRYFPDLPTMDTFYIKNAALYRKLVKAANRTPPPRIANVGTETSPDMIVSARIRPLLEEDIAAGFPCAVFPRSEEAGVVDVHNLYNHPRGRPILKVRDNMHVGIFCQSYLLLHLVFKL